MGTKFLKTRTSGYMDEARQTKVERLSYSFMAMLGHSTSTHVMKTLSDERANLIK